MEDRSGALFLAVRPCGGGVVGGKIGAVDDEGIIQHLPGVDVCRQTPLRVPRHEKTGLGKIAPDPGQESRVIKIARRIF